MANNALGGKEFKAWLAEAARLAGAGSASTKGDASAAVGHEQEVSASILCGNDGKAGGGKTEEAADYRKDSMHTDRDLATPLADPSPIFAHHTGWADNPNDTESSEPTRPAAKELAATSPTPIAASVQIVSAALAGEDRPGAADQTAAPAEQVAAAMLGQAATLDGLGRLTLHLQLDTPGLGAVRLHLSAGDRLVHARLVVQQESTRQLLESQVGILRDRLLESGVVLGRFAVTREGGGSGSNEQSAAQEQMPAQPRSQAKGAKKRADLPGRAAGPQGTIDVIA